MSPDDPRHGTHAGYMAHAFGDRDYCDACREGHAAYQRALWRRRYLMRTPSMYVDALGTHRRIRALQALGWLYSDIDARLNVRGWAKNALTQRRVHVNRARALAVAYDRMSMTVPPMTQGRSHARSDARRKGYAPPLAWDDIDDPAERPKTGSATRSKHDVDPMAVERAIAGDRVPLTTAERHAVVAELRGRGWSLLRIEAHTGITKAERYGRGAA